MKNNFIDETRAIIDKYNIPTRNIEIEITESVMIESAEKALERINTLKDMGFKIAIDDFGTGYSNMERIIELAEKLKKYGKPVTACDSIESAVYTAKRFAADDGVACCVGSLYMAGEARERGKE